MFVDTLNGQLFFFVNDTPIRIPADQVGQACFLFICHMVLQYHASTICLLCCNVTYMWYSPLAHSVMQGIAGHTAQTGDVLVLDDVYNDPLFHPQVDRWVHLNGEMGVEELLSVWTRTDHFAHVGSCAGVGDAGRRAFAHRTF